MITKFTLIFLSLILIYGCTPHTNYIYDKMDNIKVEESIKWGLLNGKEFIIKRIK